MNDKCPDYGDCGQTKDQYQPPYRTREDLMQLKARTATAVGVLVEAARQSGMLEQISKVLCWRHTQSAAVADEIGAELLTELIEIFHYHLDKPWAVVEEVCDIDLQNIAKASAEEIAPFSGLRLR